MVTAIVITITSLIFGAISVGLFVMLREITKAEADSEGDGGLYAASWDGASDEELLAIVKRNRELRKKE